MVSFWQRQQLNVLADRLVVAAKNHKQKKSRHAVGEELHVATRRSTAKKEVQRSFCGR
jgi:hypothetical protein